MNQAQLALPTAVPLDEIFGAVSRKKTFGSSIELCAELNGFALEKSTRDHLEKNGLVVDKGQFSRWKDESEGVMWTKLCKVMDIFGNDAPLFWMNYQRGWDLFAMRKQQTETEKKLAEAQERIRQLENERAVELRLFSNLRITA